MSHLLTFYKINNRKEVYRSIQTSKIKVLIIKLLSQKPGGRNRTDHSNFPRKLLLTNWMASIKFMIKTHLILKEGTSI